ncbi:MAG TPA: ABC transporter permease [Candidatus Dormibacteraeota bacterium]|jgi:NitT/TauT family transport system permease protein/taurine transport system permease protein
MIRLSHSRAESVVLGALPFVGLLVAWWAASTFSLVSRASLPGPEAVWSAAADLWSNGDLQEDIKVSLGRVALGSGIAIGLGVGLGLLAGLNRRLADILLPLAGFFNSVSGIAWIPLAITWFGLGTAAVTFIIVNAVFFLVFFNTVLGVRSVPRIMEQAVRTLGGGYRELVVHVFLPGALPHIMSGIRSGLGFGWRALIAAELIAATSGLGFLIYDAGNYLRSDKILVGILVIGLIWMLLENVLLKPLERRTVERWGTVRTL